jgi:Ca2+-binding EF-hand superfamily protein
MSQTEVDAFVAKFDEIDRKRKGELSLAEFKRLFREISPDPEDDPSRSAMYFRGIDIDDSHAISRSEFEAFVRAILSKDEDYTLKMAFRAFDKDRTRSLSWQEIRDIGKYVQKQLTENQIIAEIERITGERSGSLTYAQTVKLFSGKDIPPKTDPYDGQIPSKCCLLL